MSCIIYNNTLNINLIQVFYPFIKMSNKIIITNNILDINPFMFFILIL
jgi:hypothetical protein